jgi:uncharacterized protein YjbI with pentapeptide repeats
MANEEHVAILRQGAVVWNAWRREHWDVRPDLSEADLSGADLSRANLIGVNLIGAHLHRANLSEANLSEANLSKANLGFANLGFANLREANLSGVVLFLTSFALTDLSTVVGLDTARHTGPSEVGIMTLYRSNGKIPEVFLRGCGMPDTLIEYLPSLIDAIQPIQFYSCFISYSSKDEDFARRLHERMQREHLRVWFAPEDIKGGEKLHEQIDRASGSHDRLLLVLSESSIQSEWVQQELRRARRAELSSQRRKLFPIRLMKFDALRAWECPDSRTGSDLAEEVRQYFIPDFTRWKEHDTFEREFARLLRDLKAVNALPAKPLPPPPEPSTSTARPQNPEAIIARKKRRLEILEEQQAIKGISTPPEVVTEIEDLRREIAELEEPS